MPGSRRFHTTPCGSGATSNAHARYDRRLLRACYLAAYNSIKTAPASRTFYDRKRAEGKRHNKAVLALARRRINVLWAIIRDDTVYQPIELKAA